MKYIRLYENFNDEISIREICADYDIRNYTINDDGSIDVDGDVNLSERGLDELPLKFNKVYGNFNCYSNKLISLEGCPKFVGHNFNCSDNKLTSLKYGPEKVGISRTKNV